MSKAIPDDGDLESEAESMSEDGVSPKRGREMPGERPSKRRGRGSAAKTVGEPVLGLSQMERLLEQHAEKIMRAQKDNLDGMMGLFEQKTNEKFEKVEQRADQMDNRVRAVEERMVQMQEQLNQALRGDRVKGGAEVDRRMTLVYGGWDRETRKSTILQQLDEALEQLNLRCLLDGAPFCTGPRRSTAMSTFEIREGETEFSARKRMHSVILGLAGGAVQVPPSGKKMFATYSKSRAERSIANHAGWLKRSLASLGQHHVEQLDVEYNSGTCWYGSSMVASATKPTPPGCDEKGVLREENEGHSVWIDLGALAKESKTHAKDLKKALELHKR